jgi:peptidylprolyl isomerase
MAGPGKNQPEGLDKKKLATFLVPAVALAGVVVLIALVVLVSGADDRKMSDGSNGSANDSALTELTPGVKYREVKEGLGEPCPAGATVTIHYTGWLTNSTVFDSSKKTGQPATFPLGNLIKGWQEGIPGMKKGGIRKLVIASDKGYGKTGSPPKIPPDSVLIFEVELVDFTPPGPPPAPPRERRSPPPTDLSKMFDGTAPNADDPGLKPLGDAGLKYRDLKEGDGPVAPAGAHVVMDYIGWLTDGTTVFDSSWNSGRTPLDMSLGELIAGWQQGVPGMKVGGIRKLVIPAPLGYGSRARDKIPADSTLIFQIELLGVR